MKKFLFIMLIALFTVPVFAKNTILILGDSLSAGYGVELSQGWVSLLKERLEANNFNYDVVNVSISGNTTSNGLAQLPPALNEHKPKITIIELGGNDGLRGIPLSVIKNNLQTLITLALKVNSKILLVGVRLPPNYGEAYTNQFQKIYTDLAEENNIAVLPLFLNHIDTNTELMQADKLHPAAAGQEILLNNIWAVLKGML